MTQMTQTIKKVAVYIAALAVLLAASLFLLPEKAEAATYDAEYNINSGSVTISSAGNYRIYGSTTTNTITVAYGITATITLDGVNINVSGTENACAFKMATNDEGFTKGKVTVNLVGNNILKSGANCAGLQKGGSGGSPL